MADKSTKREVSEIIVHLLRHAYFMLKGFYDIQILSQGIVLSDFSSLPVKRNPLLLADSIPTVNQQTSRGALLHFYCVSIYVIS